MLISQHVEEQTETPPSWFGSKAFGTLSLAEFLIVASALASSRDDGASQVDLQKGGAGE